MEPSSSKPRPSIASALERVLRDVDPASELPDEQEPASDAKSSRHFARGDFADERGWWAKQLGHRG